MPKHVTERRAGSQPPDAARSAAAEQHGAAARDVKPGERWVFTEHRTMAEIIAQQKTRKE